ncbi:DUF349 domain-containing protein [Lutibacter sp.]|uniref:DUF349 domain-containing protein n=1 Tax=Lutibacter sp. TaxID=1925666 RepID=UPI0025BD26E6|nr:DUF349 domain-containing protein [Lutibacter sp.]MCF6180877.1 DUF349 domain-containing protein [Lutibacter sp.]
MLENKENSTGENEIESTPKQTEKKIEIKEEKHSESIENVEEESSKNTVDSIEETPSENKIELPENQEAEKEVVEENIEATSVKNDDVELSSNKAIDEIENKVAEEAEKEKVESVQMKNYNDFSLEELVDELRNLIEKNPIQSINDNVNKIKTAFNVKFGEILKNEKEKFISEGGESIDFKLEFPLKSTYNSILYDYKVKRNEFYKNQEQQLNQNLEAKLNLIEALKQLIENADGATMYKKFEGIRNTWRATGPIPKAKYNDTWRTYYHHTERFYDLLHLNNDLRDLDFKHNLEEKLKLISKAEELTKLEDVSFAFKELQTLHKLWKEEVGPVAREYRDEVWNKFSEATNKIHNKRHEFYKELKSKFEENIDKKLAVISEIELVDTSKNANRSDWQKSINEIEKLRNKFFSIGQVPRNKSNLIWEKFKTATKKFNAEKNTYFKEVKKEQLENLNKKKLLIEQAISIKDSDDWDVATDIFKKIQADWKNIGHVPRKYSDKLWKEFKDTCNYYFDRLHNKQNEGNKEQIEVFNKKKEMYAQLKLEVDNKTEFTLETVTKYVDEWRTLGRVPYEMKHIEVKFNKLLDKIIQSSDKLDKTEIEMIKFKNLINGYLEQNNYRKLDSEQLFIRKKIDETVREIQQLENNLGFISNVTEDNPLVKKVRKDINNYKSNLEIWKSKINYLRKLEY